MRCHADDFGQKRSSRRLVKRMFYFLRGRVFQWLVVSWVRRTTLMTGGGGIRSDQAMRLKKLEK